MEHEFYFPYIGNFIIPTDELIFFRGVETTNQIIVLFFLGDGGWPSTDAHQVAQPQGS